jgi:hypothetical protein
MPPVKTPKVRRRQRRLALRISYYRMRSRLTTLSQEKRELAEDKLAALEEEMSIIFDEHNPFRHLAKL